MPFEKQNLKKCFKAKSEEKHKNMLIYLANLGG